MSQFITLNPPNSARPIYVRIAAIIAIEPITAAYAGKSAVRVAELGVIVSVEAPDVILARIAAAGDKS